MKFKGKRLASSIVAVETLNLLSTGAHASTSKPDLAKQLPAQSLAKNVAAWISSNLLEPFKQETCTNESRPLINVGVMKWRDKAFATAADLQHYSNVERMSQHDLRSARASKCIHLDYYPTLSWACPGPTAVAKKHMYVPAYCHSILTPLDLPLLKLFL